MRRTALGQLRVEPLEERVLLEAAPPRFRLVSQPVADAFTAEGKPTTNYGTSKSLRVSPTQFAWLKFQVDELDSSSGSRATVRLNSKGKHAVCGDLFPVPDKLVDRERDHVGKPTNPVSTAQNFRQCGRRVSAHTTSVPL